MYVVSCQTQGNMKLLLLIGEPARLQKISTRHRYIFFSLIPTLLLSTVLGLSFLSLRFSDLKDAQLNEGIGILGNFSYLVQISLNGAPEDSVQAIAYYILNNSTASSVTIYNDQKKALAKAGPEMSLATSKGKILQNHIHHISTENSVRFTTPLREDLLSPVSTLTKNRDRLRNWGWIEIEIPSHPSSVKRYQAFTLVLIITLISWLLHLVIILQRAHQIEMLISKFSQAFSALKANNFKTSLRIEGSGDIALLEAEFNSMVYALQQSQEELFKNMQQANDDINETLETIEIQNIELDLARKDALKASRTKSNFLASMSHEIRTPLSGIIGFTKLLAKSKLVPHQQEQLGIIQKSALDLLVLINDILDFSKIEAGKLELDQSTFNLREVIEEVLDMLAPLAEERKLELISLFYADTPIYMVGDAMRVKQIITNLVNNGIKFSADGNILIRAMLESDTDFSSLIKITISDQGRGLNQVEQDSLFQAFNQLDNKTASKDGTGLGLVISKHLTELMGGKIGCISEQEKGATFWFTFRVRKDPMQHSSSPPALFSHERIALYDENPGARLAIAQQLKQLDIHYDEFENLDDFTAKIRYQTGLDMPYHVAIMSLSFSQEGDPIIPITIENIEKTLNCRIIVINHGLSQTNFQALLNKSASAVLHKPVRFMQILKTLQSLLKRAPLTPLLQNTPEINKFKIPPKILAVDDTQTNLQLLCIFLGQLGADVMACQSGKEAVALVEENDFDLIFMDYRMPDINGLEATKSIRKNEHHNSHVPIIGLTALARPEERKLLLEAGMNDCITKPVDENQLYQIITRWIGFDHSSPESAANTETSISHISKKAIDSSSQVVVDISESVQLAGGKEWLAKEMFEKLIHSIKKDRKKILAEKDNYSQLLDTIHSLHGASRYCGAPELRNQAQAAEMILNSSPDCLEQVELEVDLLISEIDKVIKWSVENSFLGFQSTD